MCTIGADPGTGVRFATKNTYDADGKLTEVDRGTATSTTCSGFTALETTTFGYDAVGNKTQVNVLNGTATPALAVSQYSYDADDRLSCTAVRMNPSVYGSLPASACTQSTAGSNGPDPIGQTLYDGAGQVTSELQGVGTSLQQTHASYGYTPDGIRVYVQDARGGTVGDTLDGFNRLAYRFYQDPTSANPSGTHEIYFYDADDNVTTWQNRGGYQIQRTYDHLDRKLTEQGVTGGTANISGRWWDMASRTFSYDLMGRRLTADAGTVINHWAYDTAGRMTTFTGGYGGASYQYDAAGNTTQMAYSNGTSVAYAYDALNRMTTASMDGTLVATLAYGDPLGRRSGITYGDGSTVGYSYDTADRLSGQSHIFPNGTSANVNYAFQYDPASRLTVNYSNNNAYQWATTPPTTAYGSVNGANQYPTAGGVTYSYLPEGPLMSDGTINFGFDELNQASVLSKTANTSDTMIVQYDALGQAVARQRSNPSGQDTIVQGVFGGLRPELLFETNYTSPHGAGTYTSVGARKYVLGPNPDERLAYKDTNGTIYYPHTDRQGSTIGLSTGGQNVLSRAYGPYGEATQPIGALPGASAYPYLYTGQYYDGWSGYYDYKARLYSPTNGQFIQPDPIGQKDDINLYAYAKNNPITGSDPTGTDMLDEIPNTAPPPPLPPPPPPPAPPSPPQPVTVTASPGEQPGCALCHYGPRSPAPIKAVGVGFSFYQRMASEIRSAAVSAMKAKDRRKAQQQDAARKKGGDSDDPRGGPPGNNQDQNAAFAAAAKGLSDEEKQQLHRLVSKRNYGYHEIKELADQIRADRGEP